MRICSGPGCLRVVKDAVRFCDECQPPALAGDDDEIRTHTSGYDAEMDALRKSPRWQRTRKRIVQRQPLCGRCELHYTEIVDHTVPAREAISQARLSGRYPLDRSAGYFLESNLQGLCRGCHGVKTTEDKAHVGPWPDVVERERLTPKRVRSF